MSTQGVRLYYQDANLSLTSHELVLEGKSYRLDTLRAVRIDSFRLQRSTMPVWVIYPVMAGVVLFTLGWFVYMFAQLAGNQPLLTLLRQVDLPIMAVLVAGFLCIEFIDRRRPRQVIEVPVLNIEQAGRLSRDIWFASADLAYLRGLAALLTSVLGGEQPAGPTLTPPLVQVDETGVHLNDYSYHLSEIQSVSYEQVSYSLPERTTRLSLILLLGWLLSVVFVSGSLGTYITGGISLLMYLITFSNMLLRDRIPSAYVLKLNGVFGTVYPFAATDLARVSRLIDAINAQLGIIRPVAKPPLTQRAAP
jgi:hypothetical protein